MTDLETEARAAAEKRWPSWFVGRADAVNDYIEGYVAGVSRPTGETHEPAPVDERKSINLMRDLGIPDDEAREARIGAAEADRIRATAKARQAEIENRDRELDEMVGILKEAERIHCPQSTEGEPSNVERAVDAFIFAREEMRESFHDSMRAALRAARVADQGGEGR